jgi:hypothetical protein
VLVLRLVRRRRGLARLDQRGPCLRGLRGARRHLPAGVVEGRDQLVGLLGDRPHAIDERVGQLGDLAYALLGHLVGLVAGLVEVDAGALLGLLADAGGGLLGGLQNRLDLGAEN